MTNTQINYHLDAYDGPLDLLLTLVQRNKVNIADIPILEICDQSLQFISEVQEMNMEVTSEFLVMASELLLIKSRILLPKTGEEDDGEKPGAQIIDALLLLQKAKQAAEEMRPLYVEYSGRLAKDIDEIPPEKGFPLGLDPSLLTRALNTMLVRLRNQQERRPTTLINPLIKTKVYSVEEKIGTVIDLLTENERASLFFLLKDAEEKSELIATFMGILELIKIGRILICEEEDGIESDQYELLVKFRLNPDYVPPESPTESEFENDGELQDGNNGNDDDTSAGT